MIPWHHLWSLGSAPPFFLSFFIRYFLYLHFKYYTLSLFPSENPPFHPLPLPGPSVPLHWRIKPSQDQGHLLPLMTNKAILCYISSWSHGSLYVYSWVGGLVPGCSRESSWLILLFFLWAANPFSSVSPFSDSFIGDHVLSPMVGMIISLDAENAFDKI